MLDFGSLTDDIISQLWWIVLLFLFLVLCKSVWFRIITGGTRVRLASRLFLDKNVYHLIHNIALPTENGSTRIDHMIVSRYGLFVIEINHMKGLISSGKYQQAWTQTVSGCTHKLKNPLHQTAMKATTVQLSLNLQPDKVFTGIIFTNDCIFTSPMPDNIIHIGEYIRYIKSKTELLLCETEIQQIIQRLSKDGLVPINRQYKS